MHLVNMNKRGAGEASKTVTRARRNNEIISSNINGNYQHNSIEYPNERINHVANRNNPNINNVNQQPNNLQILGGGIVNVNNPNSQETNQLFTDYYDLQRTQNDEQNLNHFQADNLQTTNTYVNNPNYKWESNNAGLVPSHREIVSQNTKNLKPDPSRKFEEGFLNYHIYNCFCNIISNEINISNNKGNRSHGSILTPSIDLRSILAESSETKEIIDRVFYNDALNPEYFGELSGFVLDEKETNSLKYPNGCRNSNHINYAEPCVSNNRPFFNSPSVHNNVDPQETLFTNSETSFPAISQPRSIIDLHAAFTENSQSLPVISQPRSVNTQSLPIKSQEAFRQNYQSCIVSSKATFTKNPQESFTTNLQSLPVISQPRLVNTQSFSEISESFTADEKSRCNLKTNKASSTKNEDLITSGMIFDRIIQQLSSNVLQTLNGQNPHGNPKHQYLELNSKKHESLNSQNIHKNEFHQNNQKLLYSQNMQGPSLNNQFLNGQKVYNNGIQQKSVRFSYHEDIDTETVQDYIQQPISSNNHPSFLGGQNINEGRMQPQTIYSNKHQTFLQGQIICDGQHKYENGNHHSYEITQKPLNGYINQDSVINSNYCQISLGSYNNVLPEPRKSEIDLLANELTSQIFSQLINEGKPVNDAWRAGIYEFVKSYLKEKQSLTNNFTQNGSIKDRSGYIDFINNEIITNKEIIDDRSEISRIRKNECETMLNIYGEARIQHKHKQNQNIEKQEVDFGDNLYHFDILDIRRGQKIARFEPYSLLTQQYSSSLNFSSVNGIELDLKNDNDDSSPLNPSTMEIYGSMVRHFLIPNFHLESLKQMNIIPTSIKKLMGKIECSCFSICEFYFRIKDVCNWTHFLPYGNECKLNKNGRNIFPRIEFTPLNLQSEVKYSFSLKFCPVRIHSESGIARSVNIEEGPSNCVIAQHPVGIREGSFWMKHEISFQDIKITNNEKMGDGNNIVVLKSGEKYVVKLEITTYDPTTESITDSYGGSIHVMRFQAKTAYSSTEVNKLKKILNKYANGERGRGDIGKIKKDDDSIDFSQPCMPCEKIAKSVLYHQRESLELNLSNKLNLYFNYVQSSDIYVFDYTNDELFKELILAECNVKLHCCHVFQTWKYLDV